MAPPPEPSLGPARATGFFRGGFLPVRVITNIFMMFANRAVAGAFDDAQFHDLISKNRKVSACRVPSEASNTPTQSLWLPSHRQKWALRLNTASRPLPPVACAPGRPWLGCIQGRDDAAFTPNLRARTEASGALPTIVGVVAGQGRIPCRLGSNLGGCQGRRQAVVWDLAFGCPSRAGPEIQSPRARYVCARIEP